jgi:hypothetical protein
MSTMTGTSDMRRISWSTSKPLVPGMPTASTTTSGDCSWNSFNPVSPVWAVNTVLSRHSKWTPTVSASRMSGSSSISRIFMRCPGAPLGV